MLLLAALVAVMSACSQTERVVIKTEFIRPTLPPVALKPCENPQVVPQRDLSQREVTTLWGRDRVNLRGCELRRAAGVTALTIPVPTPKPATGG